MSCHIFFFHYGFSVTSFRTFYEDPLLVGGNGGWEEIKMASASSPHGTAKTNDKSTNLRKNDI